MASSSQNLDETSYWDDEEEKKAIGRVVHAFRSYKSDAQYEIIRWQSNHNRIPLVHQNFLSNKKQKYESIEKLVECNQFFLNTMLSIFDGSDETHTPGGYLANANNAGDIIANELTRPSATDTEKALYMVRYVLKNFFRDWSEEGNNERRLTYGRILTALENIFQEKIENEERPLVLVPGCGLSRLVVEIASLGFEAQGNEFSYYMLLPSSFILNHSIGPNAWTIYPWILSTSNQITDRDQMRGITIPDKDPAEMVRGKGSMSMVAGDFVEVYGRTEYRNMYDCVVTCFFIDTAHNVLEYLDIIAAIVKIGGYWINLGPLLYHWVNSIEDNDLSLEIALEDIEKYSIHKGFKLIKKEMVAAPYLANPKGMYQTVYRAVIWTMQKNC